MTQITGTNTATAASETPTGNSIGDLDLDVFLDLMLAELQNQDPLDPVDNDKLLAQISQIREIGASDKLTETLDAVLLGQNVTTATGLIGKDVQGISVEGLPVSGAVQQVTINDGDPLLEIAIETHAEAVDFAGSMDEGNYVYEAVWETFDGTFSVRTQASTDDFGDDFKGSIRLDNLPELSVPMKIYRTTRTGSGDLQLIGDLPAGTTSFVDQRSDTEFRSEKIPEDRQVLRFANSATVRLNSISSVETLR